MNYYLFLRDPEKLESYKSELFRVIESIEAGTTPVYNEVRSARTSLYENLPLSVFSGIFLIIGTQFLSIFDIPTFMEVAVVLVVNNMCTTICYYLFTMFKHYLRIRLCKRLGLEPTERVIAGMESLEYQSV